MKTVDIEKDGQQFEARLADNLLTHFIGMRFRGSGKMLFRFYSESRPGIDMLLVPKTLHLYFLDEKKVVVDVQKAEPWTLNPSSWSFHRPSEESKYLLESFDQLDLEEGDQLKFQS